MKKIITHLQNLGADITEEKANGTTYMFAEKIGVVRISNHTIRHATAYGMKSRFELEIIKHSGDDDFRLYTSGEIAKKYDDYIDEKISSGNNEEVIEDELKEILSHIFSSEKIKPYWETEGKDTKKN